MIKGLLVGCVSLLQIFHHQEAVALKQLALLVPAHSRRSRITEAAPHLSIGLIELQYSLQVFDCPREVLPGPEDAGDGVESLNGLVVVAESLLVSEQSSVGIALQFTSTA